MLAAALPGGAAPAVPIAVFLLSLASLFPLPSRFLPPLLRLNDRLERLFPVLLPVLSLLLALFYGWVWGARAHHFQPVIHDEFAYLFQAKTFLAGRLFFPSPAEPAFFDAFHILLRPVFASKYPPGHALALAGGALFGAPWMVPLLVSGLSLFLIGRLARPHLGAAAALLLVVFFGVSRGQFQVATSYLSQSTYLLAALLAFLFFRRAAAKGTAPAAFGAGLFLGFALLVRPFNGIILASALSFALTSRPVRAALLRPRTAAAFLLPLLAAGALFLGYNKSLTGSALSTPWTVYAEQNHPEDGPGFYRGEPLRIREVGRAKEMWLRRFFYPLWKKYTPREAIRSLLLVRIPATLRETMPLVLLLFLVGLAALRDERKRLVLFPLLLMILSWAAYLFYWSSWPIYFHETMPLLLFLPLLGAVALAGRAARDGRPAAAGAVAAILLVALALSLARLPSQIRFRRLMASRHARFTSEVMRKTPAGSILFLRYAPAHNPEMDFLNNEPDLAGADRVYAYDLGPERNRALLEEHFPGRKPFLYDERRGVIRPGFGE